MNPANIPTCPACGGQLVAGSNGALCPACMLQASIADDPVADDASPQESRGEQPGARIGRYKLLERIGEGGFGVVWMAEQEEPVRRRVALKIIKLGMDTREVVARFEAERQALAMMEHPNIASVFDGGATETGRPYFVMELVKGVPITTYCDANRLSTRDRLELFVEVCHAVQHAHQKGVIHRDLKPSNILVTVKDDRPVPKVIDFGIAKATQSSLTEKTLFTRLNQWLGTPEYMSPEQAGLGSLDVDTRSDIYSLGVLLYELLTGHPPFDPGKLRAAGHDAVMRVIREEEPPKPSTRLGTLAGEELIAVAAKRGAEPAKLNRLVRGDLDWIVMKALEKDRRRRYGTANGLADDLRRHLNDEPVTAGAPSTLYRLQKLVRGHKTALIASTVVITALVAAVAVSTWQAVVATHARDRTGEAEKIATVESARANAAFRDSERSRTELEISFYRSQIALAYEAWDKADVAEALSLLESCPARFRAWEWNHLHRLCETGELSFKAFEPEDSNPDNLHAHTLEGQLVFSPDGSRLCVVHRGLGSAVFDSRSGQRLTHLCNYRWAGHFSEDGSVHYKLPHEDTPAQIFDVASGTTRDVPGLSDQTNYQISENVEWLARLTGSTVEVANLRKPEGGKTFSVSADSNLEALSRDGRWLVASASVKTSAANGGSAEEHLHEVWDIEKGTLAFRIHKDQANFSFDNQSLRLAVRSCDGDFWSMNLELWDLATGRPLISKSRRSQFPFDNIVFSPDGYRLVLLGMDALQHNERRTVYLLNAKTGEEIFNIQPDNEAGHGDRLAFAFNGNGGGGGGMVYGATVAAFSSDGRNFALGVMDRTVRLVECEPPFRSRILRGHRSPVCAIAFSPDGKRLASMDRRGGIRIWDLNSPFRASLCESTSTVTGGMWIGSFCASRDGALVVWREDPDNNQSPLIAINTRTMEKLNLKIPWDDYNFDCLMAIDESRVATDQGVWDVSRSDWSARFDGVQDARHLAVSRNGKLVAMIAYDAVQVWDAASGSKVGQAYPRTGRGSNDPFLYHDGSESCAFSPDARLLAVVTDIESDGIKVYRVGIDGESPGEVCRIRGRYPLCFGPTGEWLLANRPGGGFLKANTRTGAIEREYQLEVKTDPSAGEGLGWEISPNGQLAVWYDMRGSRVINLETGAVLFEIQDSVARAFHGMWASFSPDGTRLAARGGDDQIRLWDVATARMVARLPDRGSFARFSADGARLVVVSPERELSVLDGSPIETKNPTR